MSDSVDDAQASRPDSSGETEKKSLKSEEESLKENSEGASVVNSEASPSASKLETEKFSTSNTIPEENTPTSEQDYCSSKRQEDTNVKGLPLQPEAPLAMVETAFLASTASLIWLINYYFPLGPLLKIFFPVPIALVYMRWGHRASWMAALVSGLLLSVLMGPTRSIIFFIPFGIMGVQLGALWKRQASWLFSISIGAMIGTFGVFFKLWLFSILLGEDVWLYFMSQVTELAEWGFVKLGLLIEPSLTLIQAIAAILIVINNLVYLFVVHIVALLVLDRLGNPIPRPPNWVQILLDYE